MENEKIQRLLQELIDECQREEVTFVCGLLDMATQEQHTMLGGSLSELVAILSRIDEEFRRKAKAHPCDCVKCQAIKALISAMEEQVEKTFETAEDKSLDEKLAAFLRGELK
ncbi:hypothetical protein [Enterococcus sp. DIV1420a]|uniref:hypothetical protein n=1 Tax=Enterococcus sp. DIV1420a TaxID=2774672 RepID=UPI003F242146